jgi:replicative DNA helicase
MEGGADALAEVISNGIRQEDFTEGKPSALWNIIIERYKNAEPFDDVTMMTVAPEDLRFEIITCTDLADKYTGVSDYCHTLKESTKKRELNKLGRTVTESANNDFIKSEEIVSLAEKKLLDISTHGRNRSMVTAKESVDTAASNLISRLNREEEIFISSGYWKLDDIIGGFRNKNLYILAARPAKGKTALGLGIGKNVASSQKRTPVYWVSLEMGHDELSERFISSETEVNLRWLDKDRYKGERLKIEHSIRQASERISSIPLTIDDQSDLDIDTIRSRARYLKAQGKCEIVIIDYLQLIKYRGKSRIPRHEQLGEITGGLKQMAKELDIPVVALCQLNREIDKDIRKPRMSDLRESGSIEQDADCILMLWQKLREDGEDPTPEERKTENYHMKDEIGIHLAKFRQGEPCDISMGFTKEFTRFTDNIPSLNGKF